MLPVEPLRGVISPNLTPFNEDLSVALDLFVGHAQRLLDQGCVGLAPFGTTSEGPSIGLEERLTALKALTGAGVEPLRLIPGTGLANLPETVALTRACVEMGCAGVLTLPPFYYKGVSDDGVYGYFEQLIRRVDHDGLRLYLYHIPQVAGVGVSPAVVARLKEAFPDQVAGVKDSSGDWENTAKLFEIDKLIVYPGAENFLSQALPLGAPGCISASANLNAAQIAEVIRLGVAGERAESESLLAEAMKIRTILLEQNVIAAQKRLLALASGDARWAITRPPLPTLSAAEGAALADKLARECGFRMEA